MTTGDPFEELDEELRHRMAGEFRRTAEEDEYAARKAALRSRSLADVAFELLGRGDVVAAVVGSWHRYQGTMSHAKGSLASLTTGIGDSVHLNLEGPVSLEVVERSAAGGRSREPMAAESFMAKLREIELSEHPVDIVLHSVEESIAGRIEAVTKDHVMLVTTDSRTWFVPIREIAAVVERET
ncbi:MAG TPA: hypothetical protein VGC47_09930 [Acidimicrobiia bacterium]